jgi:hypothetical protein
MTRYQHKRTKKIYRITKTVAAGVYLLPDSYGAYPPRGCSSFTAYDYLNENFEPLNKPTNQWHQTKHPQL